MADFLPLEYNILVMMLALLLINWIENIAIILFKLGKRVNVILGYLLLLIIMVKSNSDIDIYRGYLSILFPKC